MKAKLLLLLIALVVAIGTGCHSGNYGNYDPVRPYPYPYRSYGYCPAPRYYYGGHHYAGLGYWGGHCY